MQSATRKSLSAIVLLLSVCAAVSYGDGLSADSGWYKDKGYQPIGGAMQGSLKAGVYAVLSTITVPSGSTLSIEPGALLVFANSAGLIVNGMLYCRGTSEGTVNFAALASDKYKESPPADIHWKGIVVAEGASIDMRYCLVNGAAVGVELKGPGASVTGDMVNFRNSADAVVRSVKGDVPVAEGKFVSFTLSGADDKTTAQVRGGNTVAGAQPSIPDKHSWKRPMRIASIGVGVMGAAACVSGIVVDMAYYGKYRNATSADGSATVDKWRQNAQAGTALGIAGGIVTLLGAAGITMTFTF